MSFVPKVKKLLTVPFVKFEKDVPVYLQITNAMYEGKSTDPKKENPTVADVVFLETGEIGEMWVPSVVKSILNESYPKDSYVGKGFSITKIATPADSGKKYSKFSVSEIEVPGVADQAAGKKGAK